MSWCRCARCWVWRASRAGQNNDVRCRLLPAEHAAGRMSGPGATPPWGSANLLSSRHGCRMMAGRLFRGWGPYACGCEANRHRRTHTISSSEDLITLLANNARAKLANSARANRGVSRPQTSGEMMSAFFSSIRNYFESEYNGRYLSVILREMAEHEPRSFSLLIDQIAAANPLPFWRDVSKGIAENELTVECEYPLCGSGKEPEGRPRNPSRQGCRRID